MSDIVERLTANLDKYPGFQNMNSEAAAEIARLREELAYANDQRRMMADIVTNPDPEVESLRDRLAAWKAEAEAWREWYYNEPEVIVNKPTLLQEAFKCVAATVAIEKGESA